MHKLITIDGVENAPPQQNLCALSLFSISINVSNFKFTFGKQPHTHFIMFDQGNES